MVAERRWRTSIPLPPRKAIARWTSCRPIEPATSGRALADIQGLCLVLTCVGHRIRVTQPPHDLLLRVPFSSVHRRRRYPCLTGAENLSCRWIMFVGADPSTWIATLLIHSSWHITPFRHTSEPERIAKRKQPFHCLAARRLSSSSHSRWSGHFIHVFGHILLIAVRGPIL